MDPPPEKTGNRAFTVAGLLAVLGDMMEELFWSVLGHLQSLTRASSWRDRSVRQDLRSLCEPLPQSSLKG